MSYTRENRAREASRMLDPLRFDPRLEVGAYLTDGNNLYEVVSRMKTYVMLENCINEICEGRAVGRVLQDYRLVKRSPQTPDFLDISMGDAA
jgi:hypothetical protein